MKNIINYSEIEMSTMVEKKFNVIDSLILSQLSYFEFSGMLPSPKADSKPVRIGDLLKAEMFGSMLHGHNAQNNRDLLFALAASPRFRDILVNYYTTKMDKILEEQFSAMTFLIGDNTAYIAFRGTDATFVGWKEDFNMAYICPVPSQKEAVRYLNTVVSFLPRALKLRTGGHSKGGNLATYAAMKCAHAAQGRIIDVFNHDGPGFREEILCSPEFKAIEGRIIKTLPQSSLVGMLLQDQGKYSIVISDKFGGLMQHNPFSWSVGDGDFIYAEKFTDGAMVMNRALDEWLGTLSDGKRKLFVDTVFHVLEATDVSTFCELSGNGHKALLEIIESRKNIDPETRKFVMHAVSELIKLSFKNLRSSGRTADLQEA